MVEKKGRTRAAAVKVRQLAESLMSRVMISDKRITCKQMASTVSVALFLRKHERRLERLSTGSEAAEALALVAGFAKPKKGEDHETARSPSRAGRGQRGGGRGPGLGNSGGSVPTKQQPMLAKLTDRKQAHGLGLGPTLRQELKTYLDQEGLRVSESLRVG